MKHCAILLFVTTSMALQDPPSTGTLWQTGANGVEFQPAQHLSPLAEAHLRRLTSNETKSGTPYDTIYVDGTETYYDEYAQAWRVLGFYIDCDTAEENNENECVRYLLWAAVSEICNVV